MLHKSKILPQLIIVAMLIGCNNPITSKDTGSFSTASVLNENISTQEKAEKLALMGEKFIQIDPQDTHNIVELFNLALQLDANNKRALLYRALYNPVLTQKGIFTRVRSLVGKISQKALNEYDEGLSNVKQTNWKSFLTNGTSDIATIDQAQEHLAKTQESLSTIRLLIEKLRPQGNFVINVYSGFTSSTSCRVESSYDGAGYVFKYTQCMLEADFHKVTIEDVDWQALKFAVAGYELFLSLASSYSLEGALEIAKVAELNNLTEKEFVSEIKKHPALGVLKRKTAFNIIKEVGQEAIDAFKEAATRQAELCVNNEPTKNNRPGMLFEQGFCVARQAINDVENIQKILSGTVVIDVSPSYRTLLNVSPFLNAQLTDLKTLLPEQFTTTGNAILESIPNKSASGLLPRADLDKIVRARQIQN